MNHYTPDEMKNRMEHAHLVKQAKEKGHKAVLKMWEENHWKDANGRWHTEGEDEWENECGISELTETASAKQYEKVLAQKAKEEEAKERYEAFNVEAMTPAKLVEVEIKFPNAKHAMENYLSKNFAPDIAAIFWGEYQDIKEGNPAF